MAEKFKELKARGPASAKYWGAVEQEMSGGKTRREACVAVAREDRETHEKMLAETSPRAFA